MNRLQVNAVKRVNRGTLLQASFTERKSERFKMLLHCKYVYNELRQIISGTHYQIAKKSILNVVLAAIVMGFFEVAMA